MATFQNNQDDWQRLDWSILQNGSFGAGLPTWFQYVTWFNAWATLIITKQIPSSQCSGLCHPRQLSNLCPLRSKCVVSASTDAETTHQPPQCSLPATCFLRTMFVPSSSVIAALFGRNRTTQQHGTKRTATRKQQMVFFTLCSQRGFTIPLCPPYSTPRQQCVNDVTLFSYCVNLSTVIAMTFSVLF